MSVRGHKIEFRDGQYFFCDTGKPTIETWKNRSCGYCNSPPWGDGPDPCIGKLPGIINACCGHGDILGAYIQFNNSSVISGQKAIDYMKIKVKSFITESLLEQKLRKLTTG